MKPLNFDNSPCSPISSNCVIWQGPNLDCIKLCTGDTVSDVVAKLATELCTIMDQLNISNYDLSCFDLVGCKPDTYQAFLQFLIDQVPWDNFITIDGSQNFFDLCFKNDKTYDPKLTMCDVMNKNILVNNNWIMPRGHPSINGHKLLASELHKILSI
jgi:hypothetical protein